MVKRKKYFIKKAPAEITQLEDLLLTSFDIVLTGQDKKVPMFMMTNTNNIFGASAIAYPGALKNFVEKAKIEYPQMKTVFVLPSSVHEVILLLYNGGIEEEHTVEELRNIVKQVNACILNPMIVLSDDVYVYDAEKDVLSMAA